MSRAVLLISMAFACSPDADLGGSDMKDTSNSSPAPSTSTSTATDISDIPTWVNASYLTCHWNAVVENNEVEVLCDLASLESGPAPSTLAMECQVQSFLSEEPIEANLSQVAATSTLLRFKANEAARVRLLCNLNEDGLIAKFGHRQVDLATALEGMNNPDFVSCIENDQNFIRKCFQEFNVTLKNGTSPTYPLSCAGAANRVDGVYVVDPEDDGQDPIEVYCDMTTDGGGWTLVASSNSSNTGLNSVSELLAPTVAGMLQESSLVALANISQSVRITGDGKKVLSKGDYPINRMRAFLSLNAPMLSPAVNYWSGDTDYLGITSNNSFVDVRLSTTVYHAAGNIQGLHWSRVSGNMATWIWNERAVKTNLNLWVK